MRLAITLLLAFLASASAHPQLLFARLSSDPATPPPGEQFEVQVSLSEPSGLEVPGLDMRLWIYPRGASVASGEEQPEPLARVPLRSVSDSGIYRGTVPALEEGVYPVRLVELVRDSVESTGNGELPVGIAQVDSEIVLPPVAAGVGAWLVWLVGLPLVAGLLVTILILTGRGREEDE